MTTTVQTEERLVSALQQHRSADFTLLYEAYSPALYGVLLRLLNDPDQAQDVLQDAFVKIWSNYQHYDPRQGRLFTWLLTITRNLALDELRARKVQLKASAYLYERAEPVSAPRLVEGLIDSTLVSPLAPKYRAVVELMYYQDMTCQEAATKLKLPVGTVKTRVRTALQQLRAHFSQDIQHYHVQYRLVREWVG